ncbi:MAG: cytochrome-c peroxidase [Ignavibacteriales bacterium]
MKKRSALGFVFFVIFTSLISVKVISTESLKSDYHLDLPLGLDEFAIEIPKDNPLTKEKIALGGKLYFDPRLSANGTVSCASCHNPKLAFTDGQKASLGIRGQIGRRSAPTIINRVFGKTQFWDGRASSLEEQAKGPMINPIEMGNRDYDEVVKRLRNIKGYREGFKKAFGTEEFTIEHIAEAIASFERTVVSGNSPFDKFESGGDEKAVSESAKRGLDIFRDKGRCSECHAGFNFTDEKFHNTGAEMDKPNPDLGRYEITKKEEDRGAFKTPTLREIARTGPYMHDGSLKTLEEVVEFYDKGGIKNPNLDKEMKPLNLTDEEKRDLVEFLKTLNEGGWQKITAPKILPQ